MQTATARVRCCDGWHRVRYENGRLKFDGHGGTGRELERTIVLAEFGSKLEGCARVLWAWRNRQPELLPKEFTGVFNQLCRLPKAAWRAVFKQHQFGLCRAIPDDEARQVDHAVTSESCALEFVRLVQRELLTRGIVTEIQQHTVEINHLTQKLAGLHYKDAKRDIYLGQGTPSATAVSCGKTSTVHPEFVLAIDGRVASEPIKVCRRIGAVGGRVRKTANAAANLLHAAIMHGRICDWETDAGCERRLAGEHEIQEILRSHPFARHISFRQWHSDGVGQMYRFDIGGEDYDFSGRESAVLAMRIAAAAAERMQNLCAASQKRLKFKQNLITRAED